MQDGLDAEHRGDAAHEVKRCQSMNPPDKTITLRLVLAAPGREDLQNFGPLHVRHSAEIRFCRGFCWNIRRCPNIRVVECEDNVTVWSLCYNRQKLVSCVYKTRLRNDQLCVELYVTYLLTNLQNICLPYLPRGQLSRGGSMISGWKRKLHICHSLPFTSPSFHTLSPLPSLLCSPPHLPPLFFIHPSSEVPLQSN